MDNEHPLKAITVVVGTALVCSILVTVAAVTLQPIQQGYEDLERIKFIVAISGLTDNVEQLSELEIITAFQQLEPRIVDIDQGVFDDNFNARNFDTGTLQDDPEFTVQIPVEEDVAQLGQRSRLATIYTVGEGDDVERIIFPVYGRGMWSTIYGFLALESDLNTIAAITISEHGETPGIGDAIEDAEWQRSWRGRRLYDDQNRLQLSIVDGAVDGGSETAIHEVDGLAGATVTVDGLMNLVRYWFGPHGFSRFLNNYSATENL